MLGKPASNDGLVAPTNHQLAIAAVVVAQLLQGYAAGAQPQPVVTEQRFISHAVERVPEPAGEQTFDERGASALVATPWSAVGRIGGPASVVYFCTARVG